MPGVRAALPARNKVPVELIDKATATICGKTRQIFVRGPATTMLIHPMSWRSLLLLGWLICPLIHNKPAKGSQEDPRDGRRGDSGLSSEVSTYSLSRTGTFILYIINSSEAKVG